MATGAIVAEMEREDRQSGPISFGKSLTSQKKLISRCVVNDAVKNAIQKCVDDLLFEHVRVAKARENDDVVERVVTTQLCKSHAI